MKIIDKLLNFMRRPACPPDDGIFTCLSCGIEMRIPKGTCFACDLITTNEYELLMQWIASGRESKSITQSKIISAVDEDKELELIDLLWFKSCRRCGGPTDFVKLLTGEIEESNTCSYCGEQSFDVAVYFVATIDYLICSISVDVPSLKLRESLR